VNRVAALLVALVALHPASAGAQSASQQAAAEALFKQARDLMNAGHYAEACPKLAESQRLDPSAGTLLNLATCYEKNGQIASAWVTYKGAATAAQRANETDRARLARKKVADLEPTLPTMTIVVPAAADRPDLQVKRDGETVGRAEWGAAIPTDPGAHTVEATAPGRKTWQGQAQVTGPGAKASVEVPPLAEDVAAAPSSAPSALPTQAPTSPPPAAASPGSTQRTIGLVVAGVGVAGLVVGTVFGLSAKSKNDGATAHCGGDVCDATGIASLDDARRAATFSTIGFAAGGAALAGGLVLYLLAPRGPSTTGLTVTPGLTASGGELLLGGAWR
jgi:hypothetical protein